MFYALAKDKIPTGKYRFEHELVDIETLNRRALAGELELTAVSVHAYAYLSRLYVLCSCGASMGDRYGPMVVARRQWPLEDLAQKTIAVPGTLTTAYLTLRLCLGKPISYLVVPFDRDPRCRGRRALRRRRPSMPDWSFTKASSPTPDQGLAAGGRPRPMVVRPDRAAAAVGGQRHPQGPRPAADRRRPSACSGRASSTDWSTATRPWSYALGFGRGLDRQLPTASSGCTSTTGRWTSARPAGRPSPSSCAGHAAGVIPRWSCRSSSRRADFRSGWDKAAIAAAGPPGADHPLGQALAEIVRLIARLPLDVAAQAGLLLRATGRPASTASKAARRSFPVTGTPLCGRLSSIWPRYASLRSRSKT